MHQLACLQDVPAALAGLCRRAKGVYLNSPEVPDVWVHELDSHLFFAKIVVQCYVIGILGHAAYGYTKL